MEQFNRNKEIISALDEKILALTDEKDLEAEIVEPEEAINSISHDITQVKCLLSTSVSFSQTAATVAQSEEYSPLHSSKDKGTVEGVAARENVIQLPRLNIPTFAGDTLSWELFWDSFDLAVHSNSTLSAVQKLTYLRSQLQGSAAQAISGLTLTSGNYEYSISLLQVYLVTVPPSTSTSHLTRSNTCLLKTAIGSISANGLCVEANIPFDDSHSLQRA